METYSVLIDFNNISPNLWQLHTEIVNNTGISKTLYGVTRYDDVINIEFASSLSGPEKIILNGIVSSHIPIFEPFLSNTLTIVSRNNEVTSNSFKRISTGSLPKTSYAKASAICYMDATATSYDVRITDKNNKLVLLTVNLTNITESVQNLGVLTNLPSSSTQIEISVRRNGGNSSSKIYVENVTIIFA